VPLIDKFSNMGEGRRRKELEQLAKLVNTWELETEELSDEELAHKTVEFRERLENGEPLDDLLPEAFAATREAARRTIGQRLRSRRRRLGCRDHSHDPRECRLLPNRRHLDSEASTGGDGPRHDIIAGFLGYGLRLARDHRFVDVGFAEE